MFGIKGKNTSHTVVEQSDMQTTGWQDLTMPDGVQGTFKCRWNAFYTELWITFSSGGPFESSDSYYTIGKLPVGARPKESVSLPMLNNSNNGKCYRILVDAGGNIKIYLPAGEKFLPSGRMFFLK